MSHITIKCRRCGEKLGSYDPATLCICTQLAECRCGSHQLIRNAGSEWQMMRGAYRLLFILKVVLSTLFYTAVAGFVGLVAALWIGDAQNIAWLENGGGDVVFAVLAMAATLLYMGVSFFGAIGRSNARMSDPVYVSKLRSHGLNF